MTNSYPFVVFGDEFKGKRVLVTGGTKGVGEAIVRRFELSGASVATTARSAPAPGLAPALFIQADLGTASGVQNVVDRIQQEWGGLDGTMSVEQKRDQADSRCSPTRTGLGWFGNGTGIHAYHTWLILEKGDGCLVVTDSEWSISHCVQLGPADCHVRRASLVACRPKGTERTSSREVTES